MLHSVALQGDGAPGMRILAFHARLMELALQAGNAAGPQVRGERRRVKTGNAQGRETRLRRFIRGWSTHDMCKRAKAPTPICDCGL